MGLCKCPKRRVTNQFCFEHRVNVCEHCMVTNHPKCIVQSYIQWLQDSDYNPICEICTETLGNKECIRLICYHVFHWSCLETLFRKLPRTTAPAGYQCPTCQSGIFPSPKLVSPVADVLREKLSAVNWARAGLGLSLLSEEMDTKCESSHNNSDNYESNGYLIGGNSNYTIHNESLGISTPHRVTPIGASDDESCSRIVNSPQYSIVQVQEDNYESYGQVSRKNFDTVDQNRHTSRFDHDEDKYKRKSASEWLIRWWKNTLPPTRNRRKRNIMALIICIIIIGTLLLILLKLGRASIEDDPFFNVENNPNVHLAEA